MTLLTLTACLSLAALSPFALAQHPAEPPSSAEPAADAPINTMCPIGKEPIVHSAGTVKYKDKTIGLCCPGCGEEFLAWDEDRKDRFVALALAGHEPGQEHQPSDPAPPDGAAAGPSYPYTLDSCPVGGKLGSMGDPVVEVYDKREVRFCCVGCIGEFEANKAKYWGEIDDKIIAQQLMHYPIDTCIVTGEKLGPDAINHVQNNRLVRLVNAGALNAFRAAPAKHLASLDAKIIETQLDGYPMADCPVGGRLGSMGEPFNFIYMNRLVRFCCGGCENSLVTEPAKYMAKLDKAYAVAQRGAYPLETCVVTGRTLGSMGEPAELVAGTRLVRFCCQGCFSRFRAEPQKHLSKLLRE